MIEDEIRRHHDPEHAAARLLHQLEADLDLVGLAADDFGLELDMAGYATAGNDQVLTARVEFGAQYLDVGPTQLTQAAQRFPAQDLLANAFPQGAMNEMRTRVLGNHVHSALAIGRATGKAKKG